MSVSVREITALGHEAMLLASALLQRVRLADPLTGFWEAADVQWWWRRPRRSDEIEQAFWTDDQRTGGGRLPDELGRDRWQCDVLLVPGTEQADPRRGLGTGRGVRPASTSTATWRCSLRDDDEALRPLAEAGGVRRGRTGGHRSGWTSRSARDEAAARRVRPRRPAASASPAHTRCASERRDGGRAAGRVPAVRPGPRPGGGPRRPRCRLLAVLVRPA